MNGTEFVSKSEYARRKGWDKSACTLNAARLVFDARGKVDVAASDEKYAATASPSGASMTAYHARNREEKKAGKAQDIPPAAPAERYPHEDTYTALAKSRAQVEAHKAALLKIELDEKEGTLVDASGVRLEAARLAREARVALGTIASRIGPLVAAESDVTRCIELIDAEVRRVCEELAGA